MFRAATSRLRFLRRARCSRVIVGAVSISLASAPAANRIHLTPKFVSGETLRYQIDTDTVTTGKATSPIADPEGASKFNQAANLIVRLEVLDVKPEPDGSTPRVRLRATYEKSSATSESDSYDSGAAALQEQYDKLQGRSVQFTIEPDGKVTSVTGLDDVLANPSAASSMQAWMDGLSSSAKFPKEGIEVGQKWTNDRPLANTPLAGLTFHTESTYLRNEACPGSVAAARPGEGSAAPATNPGTPDAGGSTCATILTRFEIFRHGSAHGDATPDSYLQNGLRTSGTWTGAGESLDSVSLSNGIVVRSTQTGKQDMDFSIVSAASGSKMHYSGHVESRSEITLLPAESKP
jgi:hypothetical protein